eukprot:6843586-Pyramimonas_sp.AAC.1
MRGLSIDQQWQLWVASAGFDLRDIAPAAQPEYFGRAEPLRFTVKPPPCPRALAFPLLSPIAHWWRLLARCFEGLATWRQPNLRSGISKLNRCVQARLK